MIKKTLFQVLILISFLLANTILNAQTTPTPTRNITGIVRDSLNKPITGATVLLISAKDTLKATTNTFGFYGFPNVRSADFLLSVKALGHKSYNRKYFNNDTKTILNIPPIRLGIQEEQLENVTITRLKGPVIKGDTTEFWAKDYIVRDYARLEDLLKRMEGVTIDPDGSVFYNNELVTKALFNGSKYFSGSVKEAMKELPADIVERIQIIDMDESGENAKKLKTEKSSKVLNIVTKADKSAGKMYAITAEQGSQSRTKAITSIKTIDGSNQFSTKAGYQQEPLGIRSTTIPGSLAKQNRTFINSPANISGGELKNMNVGIGKRFQFRQINFFNEFEYTQTINQNNTKTIGESYYEQGTLYKKTIKESSGKNHILSLNSDFNASFKEKSSLFGYLKIASDLGKVNLSGQNLQSGILNNFENSQSDKNNNNLNYNFYTRYINNISSKTTLITSLTSSYNGNKSYGNSIITTYKDTLNIAVADSILHQLEKLNSRSFTNSIQNELNWNYNQKLKFKTSLSFLSQVNSTNNKSFVNEDDRINFNPKLSFFQNQKTYNIPVLFQTEYSFKNGITLSPMFTMTNKWLNGEIGLEKDKANRYDLLPSTSFKIIYNTAKFGNLQIALSQYFNQPALNTLNPIPNYITPYNITIGNPDLKNSENLSWSLNYNKFFKRLQLNTSIMATTNSTKNGTTNITSSVIDSEKKIITTTNTFTNIDGQKSNMLNFSIGKTLPPNSNLQFSGSIRQSDNPYFLDTKSEIRKSFYQNWKTDYTFNYKKWLELTTSLVFTSQSDHNSASATKTFNQLFNGDINLSLYFGDTWNVNFFFQQNLNQVSNTNDKMSPSVLNMNIEKRIFKQKNGILSFVVMDLAKQNYLLNYSSTNTGYQQTFTNKNSNYFLLQFSWQPQAWGKSKFDNNKGRNGNGSFK